MDMGQFRLNYQTLMGAKTKEVAFYKTFIDEIVQVYERRLSRLDQNYQSIER